MNTRPPSVSHGRKVYEVRADRSPFVHQTLIQIGGPAAMMRPLPPGTLAQPLPISKCFTRYPDTRCECGQVAIEWVVGP